MASADSDVSIAAVDCQRAQIAAAAQGLGLRLADEFVDVGCCDIGMDRPGSCRLLDHVVTHQVGYRVVAELLSRSVDQDL